MIPCAAELDELRKAIRGWRPGMHVEVRVEALSKVLASYAELAAAPACLPTAWEDRLLREPNGRPKNLLANVMTVLALHPAFDGVLAYDKARDMVVKQRNPPVCEPSTSELGDWTWNDSVHTAVWIALVIGFSPSPSRVQQAIDAIAGREHVRKRRPRRPAW